MRWFDCFGFMLVYNIVGYPTMFNAAILSEYIQRPGRRLVSTYVEAQMPMRSQVECVAECSARTTCKSTSWRADNKTCLLSNKHIAAFVIGSPYLVPDALWSSMAYFYYPVIRYPGAFTYSQAMQKCKDEQNSTLATWADMLRTRALGSHTCACGWIIDGRKVYVLQYRERSCGSYYNPAGVQRCYRSLVAAYCTFGLI